jgi:hypothetical protein
MLERIVKHLQGKLGAAVVCSTLVAGLSGIAQAQQPAQAQKGKDPIVGTWLVTVAAKDGSPSFTVYEVYSGSGAVNAIDNQAPSSQETPAIGNWRKVGPRKYFEEQWQFLYNPDGSFFGTWIGQIEDIIDESGTHMPHGPFTYQIIDANGKVIDSGSGKSTAVKMPPPQGPHH